MKGQRRIGIVLSYFSQAVRILSGLLYTPIMLRLLGQSEYGLYQLVNSVVSYLGLLSLGFTGSYMRFYARYKVRDDEKEVARLNGMFMTIFLSISVICILCGLVMVQHAEAIFGKGLTAKELSRAKVLLGFMVANLTLSFPNSVFNCCITAHEQFIFQRLLNIVQELLNPFITLPLLLMGYGSVGMVVVSTGLTVAVFFLNAWFTLYKLKERFLFKGFRFSLLREMWSFTFFIFLNQIIDQVNWSVDRFLLGRYLGTTAVAVYGVGGQINSLYLQFSTAVSGVFTPEVNRIVAESGDERLLSMLFTKVGRIQFMVLFWILSGFWFYGRTFIDIWAGTGYGEAYYVTLLLITPVTVPLIQNLGIEIQRAKNRHRARSAVYLVIAVLNVLLSIPLIKFYGPVGAAVGTAISLALGNIFFMNWYYHNKIGLDMISFWKNIMHFIPVLIVPLVLGGLGNLFIKPQGMVQVVVSGILYSCLYFLFMFKFGMNDEEKRIVTGIFVRRGRNE